MKLVLLDGAPREHVIVDSCRREIASLVSGNGWELTAFDLPHQTITDCVGDFKCWTQNPGVCAIDDANREIARATASADVLVLLTRVTFGGYASDLKKALDHFVQNISPLMTTIDGETHHVQRYHHLPRLLGLGVMSEPNPDAERVFRTLVGRNSLNMGCVSHGAEVLHEEMLGDEVGARVRSALLRLAAASPDATGDDEGTVSEPRFAVDALVAAMRPQALDGMVPRHATVIVGSPRGTSSTSAVLGRHLVTALSMRGVPVVTRYLTADERRPDTRADLMAAATSSDVVVLATPLYVDSLPTAVIRLLERIDDARRGRPPGQPPRQKLAAIVNCGFPEVRHNYTAVAIMREFARSAGYAWAGALALGGGAVIDGTDLARLGARVRYLAQALDLAADDLAAGGGIPCQAADLFARKVIPYWLYRMFANHGFRAELKRRSPGSDIAARPYAATTPLRETVPAQRAP